MYPNEFWDTGRILEGKSVHQPKDKVLNKNCYWYNYIGKGLFETPDVPDICWRIRVTELWEYDIEK